MTSTVARDGAPTATLTSSVPATAVLTAARVALGALWLNESLVKYRVGFGEADIGFVVSNAATGTRVPGYFATFSEHVLGPAAGAFGVIMPLLELALGLALVLGAFTLTAAAGSVVTLVSYWSADQLVDEYPLMLLLAVPILLWPHLATRWSATAVVLRATHADGALVDRFRRWL